MAAIFGEGKIFENCSDTLWFENFDEIALSRTVKEIEANLCFAIFGKVAITQSVIKLLSLKAIPSKLSI